MQVALIELSALLPGQDRAVSLGLGFRNAEDILGHGQNTAGGDDRARGGYADLYVRDLRNRTVLDDNAIDARIRRRFAGNQG